MPPCSERPLYLSGTVYTHMKTHLTFFYIFFLLTAFTSQANRGFEKKMQRADQLYTSGSYGSALDLYLEIYSSDSSNCELNYKIGDCYLRTEKSSANAEKYLKK